jgi:ABC-type lipoprotein release transport system permease subunit
VEDIELSQPVVEEQALAIYSDKQMPVNIKGISHDYNKLTQFDDVIRFGEFELGDSTDKYAIISILVASNLQSGTGFYDYLRIYTPKRQGVINIANPAGAFRQDSLHISAIYQTDQNTYDRDMVFLPIEVAKRLLSYDNNTATAVELKLRKNADETAVINRISSMLGDDYTVNDRLMQQASAYKMVNVEKWVTFLLLSFILIIASFNVISSLSLLIIEKDESITTFRNLGATNRQITQIFVTEGLLISFIGALTGILLGVILCLLQQEFGLIKLAGDKAAVIIDSYPVQLIFSDLIIVFAMVAVVGLFTSVITALFMRARLNK